MPKPIAYFYQDTAENKSKDFIDPILERLKHFQKMKHYEIIFKQTELKKELNGNVVKIGDFILIYDDVYEINELKIDGDAQSSLTSGHLVAQSQKMIAYAQALQEESLKKGKTPPKVRLIVTVAFTSDYLLHLGGSKVFTLTKQIYGLKKKFPDIQFILKSDGLQKEKFVHAILNVTLAWLEYVILQPDIKPIQVPQLERTVPKGPLFSVAAGVNGWTTEKATMLADNFESLQDVCNAKMVEIESCLRNHGVVTATADATNLYEHFRKSLKKEKELNDTNSPNTKENLSEVTPVDSS